MSGDASTDRIEVYTCKLDVTIRSASAQLQVTVSATRGRIEDVNVAMQRVINDLREAFPGAAVTTEPRG